MFFQEDYTAQEPEENLAEKTGGRRFLWVLGQEPAAVLKLNLLFLLCCLPVVTIPPALLALHRSVWTLAAGRPARAERFWGCVRREWRRAWAAFLLTALPLVCGGYGLVFYLRLAQGNWLLYLPFMLCSTVFFVTLLAAAYLWGMLGLGRPLDRSAVRRALAMGLGRPLRAAAMWAYWALPLLLAYLLFPLSGLYLLLIGLSVPALAAACALYKPLAALQVEETT